MRFSSILVERVSEVTIFVPSDRTTRSKGMINSANGRLYNHVSHLDTRCFGFYFLQYLRETLNDHKGQISVGCDTTTNAFLIVLG